MSYHKASSWSGLWADENASKKAERHFQVRKEQGAFLSNEGTLDQLSSRDEFRSILSTVVHSTRENLDRPGITPFSPEEVFRWFQQITLQDVQAVFNAWGAEGR